MICSLLYEERRQWNSAVAANVWKVRGIRKKTGKERCALCISGKDVKHVLLECSETGYL